MRLELGAGVYGLGAIAWYSYTTIYIFTKADFQFLHLSLGILGKTAVSWKDPRQAHLKRKTQHSSMNSLDLDLEIGKMARAMTTRNSQIGKDLIAYHRSQMTLEEVAGMLLVSMERLLWLDADSVIWTIKHLIPSDVMQEIQKIMSVAVYQQLIRKGYVPGKDMSVDANGHLLLNFKTKTAA